MFGKKLIASLSLVVLTMLSGCSANTKPVAPTISPLDAVSEVARPLMDRHADALLSDDPAAIVVTGTDLILTLDAVLPDDKDTK